MTIINIIWIMIITIGLALDLVTSGFVFFVFSLSALISLVLDFLNVPTFIQIISFFVLSIVFIFTLVPMSRKLLKKSGDTFVTQENRLIGLTITLEEDLNNSLQVNIDGVFWTIKSKSGSIKKGSKVKIVSLEGTKYLVEEVK